MDWAVSRDVVERDVSEARIESGMKHDGVESRVDRGRIYTRRIAIDPVSHRAIGVVVVGVHAGVGLHLVAVPALPHGPRTVANEIPPRGIFRVEKKLVSKLDVAGLGQLLQQIGSPEESRAEQAMIRLDLVNQFL